MNTLGRGHPSTNDEIGESMPGLEILRPEHLIPPAPPRERPSGRVLIVGSDHSRLMLAASMAARLGDPGLIAVERKPDSRDYARVLMGMMESPIPDCEKLVLSVPEPEPAPVIERRGDKLRTAKIGRLSCHHWKERGHKHRRQ